MSSTPFAGSLSTKRRAELVEIAQALGIDAEAKVAELVKSIQTYMDANETKLSKSPQFKGLYTSRRTKGHADSDSETLTPELKDMAAKGRKSINKAIEKVVDAASIPLPETPVSVHRIQEAATSAAEQTKSLVLRRPGAIQRDLTVQLRSVSNQVVKFTSQGQLRVDKSLAVARDYVSSPQNLLTTSLSLELLFLLGHLVQFYDHTIFFPPPGGETGTLSSLMHSLFFWAPSFTATYRVPEVGGVRWTGDIWPALAWWFSSTVLPPLAASTIFSFAHKGASKTGHATRHAPAQSSTKVVDPLAFSLFRLFTLLLPLTSAAPSSMVDALEMSGNLQGRALFQGLVTALVVAYQLV